MASLDLPSPVEIAQQFHETYERLAPAFGYQTREDSAKPWADVPQRNQDLMIAVARELRARWMSPELVVQSHS